MDKQQNDSDPPIQALLKWVESTPDRGMRSSTDGYSYDWDVPYVSQAALGDFFSKYQGVEKLLIAIFGNHPSKEYLNARQIKENYSKICCLLISIGKGSFITQFVEHGIDDHCLPLQTHPPDFPSSASDPQFFSAFYRKQWQFCVPKLHAHTFNRHFKAKEYILPIRRIGQLGEGGSAIALKVEVPDCYNSFDKNTNDQNHIAGNNGARAAVRIYVLKSYRATSSGERDYGNEWRAYKRIHGNQPCPNIVGIYSGFRLGGRHNLLLEYADRGTLEEYLENTSPPSGAEDIIDLWESVLRVIVGLVRIHNPPSSDTADQQMYRGWHQDIKPTNILIKSLPKSSVYKFDCKLADLGISHFKRSLPFEDENAEITDTDAFGTRFYGAPECFRLGAAIERYPLNVRRDVDVWSLGCVLSEVATWVVCNWKMVVEYRNQRRDETARTGRFGNGDYCFHDGQDGVLKCVNNNHDELVARHVKAHDYVTTHVLKLVKDDMLKPNFSKGRRSAAWLYGEADNILKMAKREVLKPEPASIIASSESITLHPSTQTLNLAGPTPVKGPLDFNLPLQPPHHPSEVYGRPFVQRDHSNRNDLPGTNAENQSNHSRDSRATEYRIGDSESNLETVIPLHGMSSTLPQHPRSSVVSATPPLAPNQLTIPFVHPPERPSGDSHSNSPNAYTSIPLAPNTTALAVSSAKSDDHPNTPIRTSNIEHHIPRHIPDPCQSPNGIPLQYHDPLPVWPVGQALHWRRVMKDPKSRKVVHMPSEHRLDDLNKRDHAFLIDNTSSMLSYWVEARELLDLLGKLVKKLDPNGVDIYFTTPFKKYLKIKKTTQLVEIFDRHRPNKEHDKSDMSGRLSETLSDYQERLSRQQWNVPNIFRKPRPLSLYVFTDAVWQPVCDVSAVIKSLVKTLNQQNLHKQQIGIQFIQFGNKPQYTKRLQDLDRLRLDGHVDMDIVDTEPSTGNVWKMLFGAINEWFDGDDPRSPIIPTSPMIPTPGSRDRFSIASQGSGSRFSHATQHSPG